MGVKRATYKNVKRLALELGVRQVRVVANKVKDEQDKRFIREKILPEDFLDFIHYSSDIQKADRLRRLRTIIAPPGRRGE